jgi:hypothetical protein
MTNAAQQGSKLGFELLNTSYDFADFGWPQIYVLPYRHSDQVENLLFGLENANGLPADQPPPRGSFKNLTNRQA